MADVHRLIQPDALKGSAPWPWSTGAGAEVWEMFRACITGDLAAVMRLLQRDPSLVRAHYEYRTPLSFAVRDNHLHVAGYLLDHGAGAIVLGDVFEMARDRGYNAMLELLERKYEELYGASQKGEPVAAAIRERDLATVSEILERDPQLIHVGDRGSNRPIHWAVMTRNIAMIEAMLARGADINARRMDGACPIHLSNGDYHYRGWRDVPLGVASPDEVYRHLVSRGAYVDMAMACVTGDIARVRTLLQQNPALANLPSEYGSYYLGCGSPIKNAAATGHIEIVKLLLENGADPGLPEEGIAPRGHALYAAVANRHIDIARLLLQHGAFPNPEVESSADAVSQAIWTRNLPMLRLLGEHGAVWEMPFSLHGKLRYEDIIASGVRPSIRVLAHHGDVARLEAALAVDTTRPNAPAALEAAAAERHEKIVRLLLRYEPDLATRVTVAAPRRMAELLFSNGMDPNRPNWLRKTPLHDFADHGKVDRAALFIEHGADVNARDEEYCSTPLAWAARSGQLRMVKFLLRRGAKTRLPDDPEWATPVEWARRRGHGRIVRILE